jgi:hypothetical protein
VYYLASVFGYASSKATFAGEKCTGQEWFGGRGIMPSVALSARGSPVSIKHLAPTVFAQSAPMEDV